MPIKLTLKQAIGQVIMVNPDCTNLDDSLQLQAVCKDYCPGAFIFFSNSIESISQMQTLTKQIKKACDIMPYLAIDMEGGLVNRVRNICGDIGKLTALEMAAGGMSTVQTSSEEMGSFCSDIGLNLNLGPVLDLDKGAASISKYQRAFSDDPDVAYEAAKTFAFAQHENGMHTCIKHFPGQGAAKGDAHYDFIKVDKADPDELMAFDLAFEDGQLGDILMTAHVVVDELDSQNPVSLSKAGMDMIRTMGFEGVILSDDIFMKALSKSYSLDEIITKFFNAGGQMLLVGNSRLSWDLFNVKPLDFFDMTLKLVENGTIDEKIIFDAAYAILKVKEKNGLL